MPFYAALVGQTSGGQGYWVGEGKAKPLTHFDFDRKSLTPLKVANIAVLSDEIIANANPNIEPIIRDALVAALSERLDIDFVDPAKAAVANISPASITNGVAPIASLGSDAEAVRADIKAAITAYTLNNNTASGGVWIMPTNLAMSLGMMVNLLGQPEFPGITRNGGDLAGFGIIPSDYVKPDTIVLANAPEIYLGDEGGFAVDMSREASLEMNDAPTSGINPPTAPTGATISLWQTNSVGLRAERTINWMKRRPEAVVLMSGVNWGDIPGPVAIDRDPDAVLVAGHLRRREHPSRRAAFPSTRPAMTKQTYMTRVLTARDNRLIDALEQSGGRYAQDRRDPCARRIRCGSPHPRPRRSAKSRRASKPPASPIRPRRQRPPMNLPATSCRHRPRTPSKSR